jgi:transcriptional regulator with GAF, ATPase, and Fis domain
MHTDAPPEETVVQHFVLREGPIYRSRPRVVWADMTGQHSVVLTRPTPVGSASGGGIVVQDPTVSRLHAEFDPRDDGLWVRDLGSRNGSFVAGIRVREGRVPQGGRVKLGAIEFLVDYNAAAPEVVPLWNDDHFGRLIGATTVMRQLFATLAHVAASDGAVLIQGETGTGKELVARAIHDASPRRDAPFVVVDCAALPETLLDAELFGHAKGAFTGALAARAGAIEAAEGGTVFLDEIGELPMPMQPKLLRVLEGRQVRRVGESAYRQVNVRFVSATHRDLLSMVSAGEFREDLFFRLSVLPIVVPPLRDRREDIERLVNSFLGNYEANAKASPELLRELMARPWRGNVRELRNFVERARALGTNHALGLATTVASAGSTPRTPPPQAPPPLEPPAPPRPADPAGELSVPLSLFEQPYREFRERWIDFGEQKYVGRLLQRHRGNVASAAREAGVDRTYIYRLSRKHNL